MDQLPGSEDKQGIRQLMNPCLKANFLHVKFLRQLLK